MNRHQILTGACNGGYCYALGTVEGVVFIAYASGCDIVILASNFERVVTIPGVLRGSIKVSCVDCSTDTGKIAASYGRKIHIFEPTPSSTESNHKLDYRWFPTAELDADCYVDCLSWNVEGSRLLTGGEYIQMWEFIHSAPPPSALPQKVSFTLGVSHCDEDDPVTQRLVQAIADPDHINDHQTEPDPGSWECVWKIKGSVANMLVTSCEDNVCRIFVETILPDAGLLDLEQFDPAMSSDSKYHTQRHKNRFVQRLKNLKVFHKRRKHTKLGSDGQMNGQTLQNSSSVHDFHKFAIHHNGVSPVLHFHLACSINPDTDIPLLPIVGNKEDVDNNFRLHWLNNKELEFTMEAEKLLQELHQKLLAEEKQHQSSTPNQNLSDDEYDSDNEETGPGKKSRNKVLSKRGNLPKENGFSSHHSSFSSNDDLTKDEEHPPEFPIHLLQSGLGERLDRKIDALLLDWHSNPDYVFCIHPVDGSFLVWLIDHLDESTPFTFHQAQASFSSRLPRAFPIQDARSMANKLLIYCNFSKMDFKSLNQSSNTGIFNEPGSSSSKKMPLGLTSKIGLNMLVPNIHMVTKHNNGTLNQWQVSFAEKTKFQNIVSVSHSSRACGHRFRTNSAACHPVLPLMLTTSHHNLPGNDANDEDMFSKALENISEADQTVPTFCSELILWQVVPVGPLSKSGGLTELCRINNSSPSAFTSVAWVPTLLPSTCLGSYSNSPSTLFVASDGHCLRLFQAVIDARSLLMEKPSNTNTRLSASSEDASGSLELPVEPKTVPSELFNVISLQSSTRPGCVLELDAISNALQDWQNIQLLHVYQEQIITGIDKKGSSEAVVDLSGQHTFDENFYLVVVEKNPEGGSNLHMWKITIDSKPALEKNITGT
ncbi:DmX-like protein 1 [Bulinus truncatus]|nr:DmX-like protein 1 [Bulinus truncatus]